MERILSSTLSSSKLEFSLGYISVLFSQNLFRQKTDSWDRTPFGQQKRLPTALGSHSGSDQEPVRGLQFVNRVGWLVTFQDLHDISGRFSL